MKTTQGTKKVRSLQTGGLYRQVNYTVITVRIAILVPGKGGLYIDRWSLYPGVL